MAQIVLVHGAWHGNWCWDDFAARLAGRGHAVRLAQLRGHAKAPGRIWHRIRDYVADVQSVTSELADPPIVVGHSMGGFVVQKYLETGPAAAGVLMASAPPWGVIRSALRLAARHPLAFLKANLFLRLGPLLATPALVRDLMFRADTPAEIVASCFSRIQDESYLAFLDMLFFLRARPRRIRAPVLVLGAEHDPIFSIAQVQGTARAYRTQAEIFDGLGHNMMLDTGWERVADRIDAWARTLPPARAKSPA
jgi:pimeloyl-ACP methyl ester carboxylesterase